MATKSLMIVPPGMRIKTAVIDGEAQSVLVAKSHRRGHKLSLKVREKMAAARKKIKVPVLTVAANSIPTVQAIGWAFDKNTGLLSAQHPTNKAAGLFNAVVSPYTGIIMKQVGPGQIAPGFELMEMGKGLAPNLVVWGINKLGIFRSTNQKLANARIPIRIS